MTAVEICGGIAYGKTTLATLLVRLGFAVLLEDFQKNPFFESFYKNPKEYAFETEVTFTLQHYHQIKIHNGRVLKFACDFSPYLDMAYSLVTLSGSKLHAYKQIYREIRGEIGAPDLLIRLDCAPDIALDRIRRRGRSAEAGIKESYLVDLDSAIDEVISSAELGTRVIRIRSDVLHFESSAADTRQVLETIAQALARPS